MNNTKIDQEMKFTYGLKWKSEPSFPWSGASLFPYHFKWALLPFHLMVLIEGPLLNDDPQ